MGLLLRVIIQLSASGSIRWKEIQMPGRTAKSIEGQWTKVKTAMNEIKESMGLPVEAKPTPKRSPSMSSSLISLRWLYLYQATGKRKADVKLEADEDIFDNLSTPTKKKQQKKQKLDTNCKLGCRGYAV